MTREEILNTPEIVDFMIDKSVMVDSKMKLHNRLNELCKLAIKALEQEPKTGHWKPFDLTFGRSIYYCTSCECGTNMETVFKYCPNCGAKMVEPQEREE